MPALPPPVRALTAAVRDGVAAAGRATTAPSAAAPSAAAPSAAASSGVAAPAEAAAGAAAGEVAAFADAAGRLAALDPVLVADVLGGTVRSLLEERHPDGLDAEDLRTVLEDSTRAAGWAGADPEVLLVVLTGALGLTADDPPALPPAAVARHALLLLAHLTGGIPPTAHLDAAVAELARAQTVEMP